MAPAEQLPPPADAADAAPNQPPTAGEEPDGGTLPPGAAAQQPQQDQRRQEEEEEAEARVLEEVEKGMHVLYRTLCEACEGPQVDLLAMTFERGDAPCVW